jgi:MFS superfamily sulfate permease-like transporter|tara:strand:+ start:435 stop:1961 length:1527 start_codon:yes stop_codon:yes gene_type:complete
MTADPHSFAMPKPMRDIAASFVVFLVAMPLCMGIAIASGVPAELGLITGIIGGIVVGLAAGSPLQVSGPAAGLAVIVFDIVQRHGLESLVPILVLAGILQLLAGFLKLGTWFRGVSPAVVHGMLAGIGVLILAGQLHVLMDQSPEASGLANLAAIPGAFFDLTLATPGGTEAALAVGITTIVAMLAWDRWKPKSVNLLPGPLMGVLAGVALTAFLGLNVNRIVVPDNILAGLTLPVPSDFAMLADVSIVISAIAIAFIASAETLLSAAAVDRMQSRVQTRFNKELGSQGLGNLLCGLVGALPMTGVIVRSSTNVLAGAVSRWSAVLHGIWILAFVAIFPSVLAYVPTASLAGILVVVGAKLVKIEDVKTLFRRHGTLPAAIWAATMITVVTVDLLTGVLVGLALSLLEIIPHMRGGLVTNREARNGQEEISLSGKATALRVDRLTQALDSLPADRPVRLDMSKLSFCDHSCAELIADVIKRRNINGQPIHIEAANNDTGERISRLAVA